MARIDFEIDFGSGFVAVDPPINYGATVIERIWANGNPSATVQSINYEWVGDTANKLNEYKNLGKSGGNGILEGPGLRLSIGGIIFFLGCIDTANKGTMWECDRVKAPIKETGRIDWFKTMCQSISPAYLKRLGIITTADYKKIPYTKTDVIDRAQLTILFLQEIVMIQQLIKEIVTLTADSVKAGGSATDAAVSVGLLSGSLAADITILIAEDIYIGTLVASIALTGTKIFDQIVQTKKYKYGMRMQDLLNKFCQYLTANGTPISLSSSIFQTSQYKDVTIIPRKIVMPKAGQSKLSQIESSIHYAFERAANEVNTSKSYGHSDGSYKDLFDSFNLLFNTAPVVDSGKLFVEEKNSYEVNSSFILPDTGPEGYTFNYPDPHTTNASQLSSYYLLLYATDASDLNTIYEYQGTSIEINMLPTHIHNQSNLLLAGTKRIDIPYAHAKRKEYLNDVEIVLETLVNVINSTINSLIGIINGVISAINTIISWFGGSPMTLPTLNYLPTNVMAGRIGWMLLSNDTFDMPKIFIGHDVGGDWHIHPNNAQWMAAETILNTFHPKELATRGGQWNKFGDQKNTVKIKYCLKDDLLVSKTNIFTTTDGKSGKFDTLKWKPTEDIADASFGINEDFTTNLTESISIDGH